MNSKKRFVFLLIISLLMVIGTIFFSANLISLGNSSMALVLLFIMIIPLGILSVFIRKCYYDLKAGVPGEDERTKKVRLYAAGYAYFISLYVWILLLAFNKYLDDDLLMIGLFGMTVSFYLSWVLLNRKKGFE
ncbi:MAG: hypothetical protein APF76_03660 [Desulfitibacter sp. BRH_c19]|nr:MAG: hypothetical protein APF76_03660 [Desulfitibacter sp. BRH_c19]